MRRLDVAWRPNSQGHARAGIVVPRFGHTAVARNRLRRRVREIVRREMLGTLPAIDLVVRTKPAAYGARFGELRAELSGAVERMLR